MKMCGCRQPCVGNLPAPLTDSISIHATQTPTLPQPAHTIDTSGTQPTDQEQLNQVEHTQRTVLYSAAATTPSRFDPSPIIVHTARPAVL